MLIMGLYKWIDLPLAETLHNLHLQQSMPWLTLLTHLGIGLVYIGLLTALALVLRYVIRNTLWEQRTWFLWWCVVIPNVV